MKNDRYSAPRQQVLAVRRVGGYGAARWEHDLACGHVEVRARRSPYDRIACPACDSPRFAAPAPVSEAQVAYWRTGLAQRLRVPVEAVEVVVGADGRVAHAMAWLDASAVHTLLNERHGKS